MENTTTYSNMKKSNAAILLKVTFLTALVMIFLVIPYSVHAEETANNEATPSQSKTSSDKTIEKKQSSNEGEDEANSEIGKSQDNSAEPKDEDTDSNYEDNVEKDESSDQENAESSDENSDKNEVEEDTENSNDEEAETEDEEDSEVDSDEDNTDENDADSDEETSEDNDVESNSDKSDSDEDTEEREDEDDVDEDTEKAEDEEKESDESKKDKDKKKDKSKSNTENISLHGAKVGNTIKKGDRDKRVIKMKKDLEKLGFKVPGNGTSLFGTKTKKKIQEFQKYYGLNVTGTLNNETDNMLNKQSSSPLQKGKRHKDTKKLKKDLKKLGLKVPGNGTILFGTKTEAKVKKFQIREKLIVNGIADSITLQMITDQLNAPLSKGMRREDVKSLKKDLAKLGFKVPGNGTNLYGTKTEKKVKEFQKYYGVKITGLVNKSTKNKLDAQTKSPLQKGKKHKDTKKLKNDLKKLGFKVPGNGTTLYGTKTKAKVKALQKYYNLKANGIADDVTLNKIKSVLKSPLQKGKRHKDTKKLKNDLKKLGFKVPGNGTTLYGTKTKAKVKALQKHYSLKSSGIADEITLNKIKSVLKTPLQKGKRHKDTKKLKVDLAKIGYAVPGNGTTLYGTKTTASVKKFQKNYKLPLSGIADEVTLKKIAALVKQNPKKKVVYLDAGHGGYDPGSGAYGLKEKNLTLDIAKRTRKQLEKSGFTVIMSRTTDKYLSLSERTKEANQLKADIFVSVHINAGGGTGIETWKMSKGPKPKESNQLANHIQNETIKQTKVTNRGVKDGNLHVNRESKMPSSLIEVGFIDTKADVNKLKKASFKNKVAIGIKNGIKKFFNMK